MNILYRFRKNGRQSGAKISFRTDQFFPAACVVLKLPQTGITRCNKKFERLSSILVLPHHFGRAGDGGRQLLPAKILLDLVSDFD
jgi:hypothetical protein